MYLQIEYNHSAQVKNSSEVEPTNIVDWCNGQNSSIFTSLRKVPALGLADWLWFEYGNWYMMNP